MRVLNTSRLMLLAALAAAGCAPAPASAPTGQAGLFGGGVTVTSRLGIQARDGYRLMLTEPGINGYGRADVAYLKVFLSRGDGDEVYLGRFDLVDDVPLKIENLKMDSTYAVRLEAYKTDANGDTRIDANADDEEGDTNAEGCETSFTTTNVQTLDLTAAQNPFKVQLLDQTFSGTASGDVEVTAGGVVGPDADERLVVEDAPPPSEGIFGLTNLNPGGDGVVSTGPGPARTLSLGAGAAHDFKATFHLPTDLTQDKLEDFEIDFDALQVNVGLLFALGTEAAIDTADYTTLPRLTAENLPENQLALKISYNGPEPLSAIDLSPGYLSGYNVNQNTYTVRFEYFANRMLKNGRLRPARRALAA